MRERECPKTIQKSHEDFLGGPVAKAALPPNAGAWVQFPVRELDATCLNSGFTQQQRPGTAK